MGWLTDEILFYGGAIVAGCAVVAAIVFFGISLIGGIRLNARLDEEYGKKE